MTLFTRSWVVAGLALALAPWKLALALDPSVSLLDDVAIAAGGQHSCALKANGAVWCWGSNEYGQLGNDTAGEPSEVPLLVSALDAVVGLAAGRDHTCALKTDGSIWCWGRNNHKQLGNDGSQTATPLQVVDLGVAQGLTAGNSHTCAVLSSGSVQCWGRNNVGQLGRGMSSQNDEVTPADVVGLPQIEVVRAGGDHTCAVVNTQVWCWGNNNAGQLGRGTIGLGGSTALAVPLGSFDAVAIAAGDSHTCALSVDGAVACWGKNANGELGIGSSGTPNPLPQPVPGLTDASGLSGGLMHTCARRIGGSVACWGDGAEGQLGPNSSSSSSPQEIGSLLNIVALAAGDRHTCVQRASGGVLCWGANESEQLGIGLQGHESTFLPRDTGLNNVGIVSAGDKYTCALEGFSVSCWGSNKYGTLGVGTTGSLEPEPQTVPSLSNVFRISAGRDHACAVRINGTLACWGRNSSGQVGAGESTGIIAQPTDVVDLGDVVSVSAGGDHTCAAKADGSAWCWGNNTYGQLGSGGADSSVPVAVVGIDAVAEIAVGAQHSCARRFNGTVWCWGGNGKGELGRGTTDSDAHPTPEPVASLLGVASQLMSGSRHMCVRTYVSGTPSIYCWGEADEGQIGTGPGPGVQPTPQMVLNGVGQPSLSLRGVGGNGACASSNDVEVKCWGGNETGRLATGQYSDHYFPTVSLFTGASAVAIGHDHACGLFSGSVMCAGSAMHGQLGDGAVGHWPWPQVVIGFDDDVVFIDGFELPE